MTDDHADDLATGEVPAVKVGKAPRPVTQQVGRIAMLVAGGVFALFALFNAHYVDFNWLFGKTVVETTSAGRTGGGVPLIILLLAAFGLGSVVGAGLWGRHMAKRAARPAKAKKPKKGK